MVGTYSNDSRRGRVLEHADGFEARALRPGPQCLGRRFGMSESNRRQFYKRWAALMAADRWAQVPSGDANGGCEATT